MFSVSAEEEEQQDDNIQPPSSAAFDGLGLKLRDSDETGLAAEKGQLCSGSPGSLINRRCERQS